MPTHKNFLKSEAQYYGCRQIPVISQFKSLFPIVCSIRVSPALSKTLAKPELAERFKIIPSMKSPQFNPRYCPTAKTLANQIQQQIQKGI
jgi:hypothetical protein